MAAAVNVDSVQGGDQVFTKDDIELNMDDPSHALIQSESSSASSGSSDGKFLLSILPLIP